MHTHERKREEERGRKGEREREGERGREREEKREGGREGGRERGRKREEKRRKGGRERKREGEGERGRERERKPRGYSGSSEVYRPTSEQQALFPALLHPLDPVQQPGLKISKKWKQTVHYYKYIRSIILSGMMCVHCSVIIPSPKICVTCAPSSVSYYKI